MISERWQQEVAETVYEAVNSDTDKNEVRKRAKNKQQGHEEGETRHIRFIVIYLFSVLISVWWLIIQILF